MNRTSRKLLWFLPLSIIPIRSIANLGHSQEKYISKLMRRFIQPVAVHPKLKAKLDRMTKLGVITKVEEPTPWVSQIVVIPKKNGGVRVCIDPRELNKALLREHYTLSILENTLHELGQSGMFTKADLSSGYWLLACATRSRI